MKKNLLRRNTVLTIFFFVLTVSVNSIIAQGNPDPDRFSREIKAFMEWDLKNTFPEDAILFVGSSSIYKWSTREVFPDHPVINRGISGAYISDINYYIRAIVLKYRPKIIIFYAGENDIAGGKNPGRVQKDFENFSTYINKILPKTKIVFLALKPTLTRINFWSKMHGLNREIKDIASMKDYLYYIDSESLMLDEEGQPRFEYFRGDGLHLNEKGYGLWQKEIKKLLEATDFK